MQALPPAIAFLLFACATFLALRFILERLAKTNSAIWAGPVLAVFGAFSGAYFHKIGLHQFFIWQLVLFALVIFSWHAKSRVNEKRMAQLTGQVGPDGATPDLDKDLVQDYAMTRRLLSFGL